MSLFWDVAARIGYDSLTFILRAMGKAKREAFKHFVPWDQRIEDVSDQVISTNNTKPAPHPPVKPHKNRMLIIGEGGLEYMEEENGTDK